MAEIEDCPPDLRALARRVPDRIRQQLSPLDLEIRTAEAASILAEAEDARDDQAAGRLRAKARRVLDATAPDGYHATIKLMNAQIREATLRGADRLAAQLEMERSDFMRRHPQADPERAFALISREVGKLNIPPATPSHQSALTRRFGKTRKGRR